MKTRTTMMLTALMSVLLLATGIGCDRSEEGAIPSTAESRLQQTTENLPADTDFAYVISDLEGFRTTAKETKSTVGRLFPIERVLQQAKQSEAGSKFFDDEGKLQLFNESFWKESGIAPSSAFTLGMVDFNTVLLTYVADQKKFEKDLMSDLDVDADPKSETIAGESVQTIETDAGTVLWNYRGKLATVVFPEGNEAAADDEETPPTNETFKRVVNMQPEKSLFQSSGFKKFKAAAGERNALAYARLAPHIKRGMLQESQDEFSKNFADHVDKSLDGFGFILETEQDRIKGRMWIGLTDKGKNHFDEMFRSSVAASWNNYVTSDTLLALRSAGNWKQMWKSISSVMPEEERQQIEQNLEGAKSSTGIDFQKDVIDNLNGQAGLVVYGIGGKASPQLMRNPGSILTKLEATYLMKFGDAEALGKLAEKANGMSDEYVDLRPLTPEGGEADDSIDVLEVTIPEDGLVGMMLANSGSSSMAGKEAPVRFYVHEDTLALATTAIPEANIQKMLKGEAAGEPISEADNLDLGAKFADQEQLSGLYINFDRFRSIFGELLASFPIASLKNAVDTLDEALLSTEAHDQGAWIDLTIDMVADTGASE